MTTEETYKCEIIIEADQKCWKIRSKARNDATSTDVLSAVNSAIEGVLATQKKLKEMNFNVAPL